MRIFHWSLVGVVVIAAATAYLGPERWLDIHATAGYVLVVLLAFRLVWGLVGGRHSRFTTFILSPASLFLHLRSLARGRSSLHAGHNPPGSWMTVFLLALLSALAVTGLVTLGGQENLGPLAAFVDFQSGHASRDWHKVLALCLVGLVSAHLGGVLLEHLRFRHPVVRAMVTGRKPVTGKHAERNGLFIRRGVVVFSAIALTLFVVGRGAASLPSGRWRDLQHQDAYVAACGDCHHAHHPSLRMAADWRLLMAGLSNHFGEDATLDEKTTREITQYLESNDATTFDTEAANMIGRAKSPSGRITETGFWKKRHKDLDPLLFKRKDIGSRVNCNACHRDAASGRFDDQAIRIPKGDG